MKMLPPHCPSPSCHLPRILALIVAVVLGSAACSGAPQPERLPALRGEPPRVLFFAFDSIPFRVLAELTDPGRGDQRLFAGFSRPVPLISSFPSTSSVAFTGILEPFELPRPPGYEARFFDRERNKVRGGGLISYYKIKFGWREFFTWRYGDPFRRALATARPVRSSVGEVMWVLEQFAASEEPRFYGYVAMTDGAAHLEGPEGLVAALSALDEGLRHLREVNPERPFYTVIYSDHGIAGGEPLINVRKEIKQVLSRNGFRLSKRIRGSDDAVMVPFGLVSSFEVYADGGQGPEIARALAAVTGVDVCVARRPGGGWLLSGPRGEAVVERRDGAGGGQWSYRPQTGDPLGYTPLVEELRRRAGDPEAEWFPDGEWFEVSWGHFYPDALHRLSRTFDLVENTASTICSLAPGYIYGAWTTETAARLSNGPLRWTHGALFDQASLGFLLTDLPGWEPPAAVRFDEALIPFAGAPEGFATPPETDSGRE